MPQQEIAPAAAEQIQFVITLDDIIEVVEEQVETYKAPEVARALLDRMHDTCLRALVEHLIEETGEDLADLADETTA